MSAPSPHPPTPARHGLTGRAWGGRSHEARLLLMLLLFAAAAVAGLAALGLVVRGGAVTGWAAALAVALFGLGLGAVVTLAVVQRVRLGRRLAEQRQQALSLQQQLQALAGQAEQIARRAAAAEADDATAALLAGLPMSGADEPQPGTGAARPGSAGAAAGRDAAGQPSGGRSVGPDAGTDPAEAAARAAAAVDAAEAAVAAGAAFHAHPDDRGDPFEAEGPDGADGPDGPGAPGPEARAPADLRRLGQALQQLDGRVGSRRRAQLQAGAWHDGLTGLPSRWAFLDRVQQVIDARLDEPDEPPRPLAVLAIDLDRFRRINAVLGPAFGDRLLRRVADRLRQVVRDDDIVARTGGDGFALMAAKGDAGSAQALARRVLAAFELPLQLDDHSVDIAAAIGFAVWPVHAADAGTLLARAEVALQSAQQAPQRPAPQPQPYDPEADASSAQNLALLAELQQALSGGQMRLYLQPVIDIGTGGLAGAEALVRWAHPQRGLLQPAQFVPFAEHTGITRQLTQWVFNAVAEAQVQLLATGVRRVAVNLSPRDLMDLELADKLDALLRRHQALAEAVSLEITERAIVDDPARAEATLQRLAERGYRLAIDDFGSGHTSLAWLKRLPVDELKIDRQFIIGMGRDAGSVRAARAAIAMGHALGLQVVAEGVETADVLQLLHELQCDEGQGFHMGRPLPLDEFLAFAAHWQAKPAMAIDLSRLPSQPLLH